MEALLYNVQFKKIRHDIIPLKTSIFKPRANYLQYTLPKLTNMAFGFTPKYMEQLPLDGLTP